LQRQRPAFDHYQAQLAQALGEALPEPAESTSEPVDWLMSHPLDGAEAPGVMEALNEGAQVSPP
jgi:hypothetical protein